MEENLIKCNIKTSKGLIIKCELKDETIKELRNKNLVSVRKIK